MALKVTGKVSEFAVGDKVKWIGLVCLVLEVSDTLVLDFDGQKLLNVNPAEVEKAEDEPLRKFAKWIG